jgi:hypothetical protein
MEEDGRAARQNFSVLSCHSDAFLLLECRSFRHSCFAVVTRYHVMTWVVIRRHGAVGDEVPDWGFGDTALSASGREHLQRAHVAEPGLSSGLTTIDKLDNLFSSAFRQASCVCVNPTSVIQTRSCHWLDHCYL